MNETIDYIIRGLGILMLLCAIIRYLSFYYLSFRSDNSIENSRSYKLNIGADRFSSKVFYKIDLPLPARLEWLRKVSNGALYVLFASIIAIVFLIVLQKIV